MDITKLFCDDNGNTSSMRVAVYFVITVLLVPWVKAAWITYTPLDMNTAGVIVGLLLTKAYQKGKELTPSA